MEGIYETNDLFDFNQLALLSPTNTPGGNYFIKFRVKDAPLYIQPPKCKTKQGVLKSNKKYYCDLMFTNENEKFIHWMERLENHCRKVIYENRDKWFDIELDEHDIENSFTTPLKLFKSGKFYLARCNVATTMGLCSLKIYNENEEEIALETLKENTDVLTVLEIQGIKCSTKNFQIEMEMKQMMVVEPKKMFEKCIFRGGHSEESLEEPHEKVPVLPPIIETPLSPRVDEPFVSPPLTEEVIFSPPIEAPVPPPVPSPGSPGPTIIESPGASPGGGEEPDIYEFDVDLDKMSDSEVVKIKKRNEIYFELYREAKRKAKIARDLALSSYLEAKHIKNTYLLEDFAESDSDWEDDFFTKGLEKTQGLDPL